MHDDITRVESAAAQHHVSVDQVTQHPELYGLTPTAITRYTNAVQTRNGLRMDSDGGKNQVFLQTYDPEAFNGRGRAAIAIGNPEKAVNTTVLVPGTGESVHGGYLSHPDGLNIYTDAQRADPGRPTEPSPVLCALPLLGRMARCRASTTRTPRPGRCGWSASTAMTMTASGRR
jgi:hypothetical protein